MYKFMLSIIFLSSFPSWAYTAVQLEESSKAVSRGIVADVQAQQIVVARRLKIQVEIDALRGRQGASNDPQLRNELNKQIKQLESQLQKMRAVR
jgi:ABC-type Fe3+/spermidine/putrescine transport system ATPase subunit